MNDRLQKDLSIMGKQVFYKKRRRENIDNEPFKREAVLRHTFQVWKTATNQEKSGINNGMN